MSLKPAAADPCMVCAGQTSVCSPPRTCCTGPRIRGKLLRTPPPRASTRLAHKQSRLCEQAAEASAAGAEARRAAADAAAAAEEAGAAREAAAAAEAAVAAERAERQRLADEVARLRVRRRSLHILGSVYEQNPAQQNSH